MDQAPPKKMAPGDDMHLTLLMAPHNLNLVTGQDRQHLLAFGRAAFEAGKAAAAAQQGVQPEGEHSATYGMNIAKRILHVGGRENAQTYIEFGSVDAVRALVGQVLRDLPNGCPDFPATHPTTQGLEQDEQRQLEIGSAIERACIDLPMGTELIVSLEKGAGTVTLFDSNGNEFDHFQEDHETFAERIHAAIDGAIAAEQVAAQAKQGGV